MVYRVVSELRKLCFSPIQSWLPWSDRRQDVFLASDSSCCRCVSGYISVALQGDLLTVMIHRNRQEQGEVKTLKIKSLRSCGVTMSLASGEWILRKAQRKEHKSPLPVVALT